MHKCTVFEGYPLVFLALLSSFFSSSPTFYAESRVFQQALSGFYDPPIPLLYFLRRPGSALGTPDFSPACLLFFRESTVLCHFFLRALCANPFLIFGMNESGIAPSRKEEALTPRCLQGYRGVSGFYDPAIPLLYFLRRPGSA